MYSTLRKEQKISWLTLILLVGFFAAVVFHYVMGFYGGYGYPYNTFLFFPAPDAIFSDFYPVVQASSHLDPYESIDPGASMYFPLAYLFYYALAHVPIKISLFLFLTTFIFSLFSFNFNYFKDSKIHTLENLKNVFILTFLSYPTLFCFERGNAECLIFILAALFLFFYQKRKFLLSGIFLACATAMKGYTGIFIFLFILDRHYREFLWTSAFALFLMVFSMLFFKNSIFIQISHLQSNLHWWTNYYAISNIAVTFNPSLYSLVKYIFYATHKTLPNAIIAEKSATLLKTYSLISGLLTLLVLINLFIRERPLWKKVCALCICSLLFPAISFDYHMILLYLPLYLFVNAHDSESSPKDFAYALLFSLLFVPKNYHRFIHNIGAYGSYSTNNLLNMLLLVSILALILFERSSKTS